MKRSDDKKTDRSRVVPRRDFEREQREPFADPLPDPLPTTGDHGLPVDFATSEEWKRIERNESSPAIDALSARWQERNFTIYKQAGMRPGQCFEVCRWPTGPGEFGIIHRIGTALQATDEIEGDTVPFLMFDPFAFRRISPIAPYSRGLTWHLRLEPRRVLTDTWRDVQTLDAVPGMPHPELPEWDDQRYQWGAWWATTRLKVPEATTLSLWFEANGVGPILSIITGLAGLLAGEVWNYRENPDARRAARRGSAV